MDKQINSAQAGVLTNKTLYHKEDHLFTVIVMMVSCTNPIKRMQQNLKEFTKKALLVPDSYKLDKFTVMDTIMVESISYAASWAIKDVKHWDSIVRRDDSVAKVVYKKWMNSSYQYNYRWEDLYIQCKDMLKSASNELQVARTRLDSLFALIKGKKISSTFGYHIHHVYEAKNKGGNMGVYEEEVYIDTAYNVILSRKIE